MSGTNTSSVAAGAFTVSGFFSGTTYVFLPTDSSAAITASILAYNGTTFGPDESVSTNVYTTVAVPGGNNFWNWGSAIDSNGIGLGAGGQVVTVGATSDQYTLTVQLANNALGSYGGEQLLLDGAAANGGALNGDGAGSIGYNGSVIGNDVPGPAVTFNGTGAAALQTLFQGLSVNLSGGSGDFFAVEFQLTDVTAGGTVTWAEQFGMACYVAGTRIATPAGETAVEALQIGDLVMTASGQARPVKWLGRRTYTAASTAANPHLRPVMIRKDAIAAGMPHRDLFVSPMHALFIDDVFVPAVSLINGVSILRSDDLAAVSYVHIEMAEHDVVFAEGMPAETFVDDASRQMFDNADEFHDLYGADRGAVTFSAQRLDEGVQLEAIRRRIAARAGLIAPVAGAGELKGNIERVADGVVHGWVSDTTSSAPVEFELVADGEVVGHGIANRYRVDLDYHRIAGGHAGFSMAVPASVESVGQLQLRRVTDGATVAGRVAAVTV
jgi:hypothetical protein